MCSLKTTFSPRMSVFAVAPGGAPVTSGNSLRRRNQMVRLSRERSLLFETVTIFSGLSRIPAAQKTPP
jgi:hypothetical protein